MPPFEIQANLLQYHRLFGLIGYPLSHSFSRKYFSQKFAAEGLRDSCYELFPLETIDFFPQLIEAYPNLVGLNVTIPYKQSVLPYLDDLVAEAAAIGAVNAIKVDKGRLIGYNTDVYGFEISLMQFLQTNNAHPTHALVLGTGGAAKAVFFVLKKMGIAYQTVSRQPDTGDLTYDLLDEALINQHTLIINTTPLGMAPNIEKFPDIPYHCLSNRHLLYDLVYNPEMTVFLQKGQQRGAATINGLTMLYGQAEHAWKIWNT